MNYYGARQIDPKADRTDAGKWRFTVRNDDRIWPTGYCATCPGHATAEEAERHYYEYEMAETVREGSLADMQRACEVCGAWTQGLLQLGDGLMESHILCDEHRNPAGLAQVRPFAPGQVIISSY